VIADWFRHNVTLFKAAWIAFVLLLAIASAARQDWLATVIAGSVAARDLFLWLRPRDVPHGRADAPPQEAAFRTPFDPPRVP
jgi:hypothetical protein